MIVWISLMAIALLLLATQASAMEAENGKGIMGKLPVFTGRKDAFVMWMAKFMAVATMGYYIEAVSYNEITKVWGEPDCPKTMAEANALSSGVPAEKLKIDMWKRNSKAFAALTLCMPDKHFRFIAGAKGMAGEVMKALFHEYRPKTTFPMSRPKDCTKESVIRTMAPLCTVRSPLPKQMHCI